MKKKIIFGVLLLSALTLVSCKNEEVESVDDPETVETVEEEETDVTEEPIEDTIPDESLTIIGAVTELKVGETLALEALDENNASIEGVTWTSSDNDIATIDENGLVTALTIGDVTITATKDNSSTTYDLTIVHNLEIATKSLQGELALSGDIIQRDSSGEVLVQVDVVSYISDERYYYRSELDGEIGNEFSYVADENGYLATEYLNYDNTVVQESYGSNYVFKELYYNPFTIYDLSESDYSLNDHGTYTLTLPITDEVVDSEILEYYGLVDVYISYYFCYDAFGFITELNLTLNDDSTISKLDFDVALEYGSGKEIVEVSLEVSDPYTIGAYTTSYETTEESQRLQTFFNEVNKGNYTATVTIETEGLATNGFIYALGDKLYYGTDAKQYLYFDTKDGVEFARVGWDGSEYTLTGYNWRYPIANESAISYIPTIDIAAELFEYDEISEHYNIRDEQGILNYAELGIIDWDYFISDYNSLIEDSLMLYLDDVGGLVIIYEYQTMYGTYGTSTTYIYNVGETDETIFDNAAYYPYDSDCSTWSEFDSDLYEKAYEETYGALDLDEFIPFFNFSSYNSYKGYLAEDVNYGYSGEGINWYLDITFLYDYEGIKDVYDAIEGHNQVMANSEGWVEELYQCDIDTDTGYAVYSTDYFSIDFSVEVNTGFYQDYEVGLIYRTISFTITLSIPF